jgi:hypothetical protein
MGIWGFGMNSQTTGNRTGTRRGFSWSIVGSGPTAGSGTLIRIQVRGPQLKICSSQQTEQSPRLEWGCPGQPFHVFPSNHPRSGSSTPNSKPGRALANPTCSTWRRSTAEIQGKDQGSGHQQKGPHSVYSIVDCAFLCSSCKKCYLYVTTLAHDVCADSSSIMLAVHRSTRQQRRHWKKSRLKCKALHLCCIRQKGQFGHTTTITTQN